jgi:hypothetical protein
MAYWPRPDLYQYQRERERARERELAWERARLALVRERERAREREWEQAPRNLKAKIMRRRARVRATKTLRMLLTENDWAHYCRWGCVVQRRCYVSSAGFVSRKRGTYIIGPYRAARAQIGKQERYDRSCPPRLAFDLEHVFASGYAIEDSMIAVLTMPGVFGCSGLSLAHGNLSLRRRALKHLMEVNAEDDFWDPTPIPFPDGPMRSIPDESPSCPTTGRWETSSSLPRWARFL